MAGDNPVEAKLTEAAFQIDSTKFYVPVVTLVMKDNIKLLET